MHSSHCTLVECLPAHLACGHQQFWSHAPPPSPRAPRRSRVARVASCSGLRSTSKMRIPNVHAACNTVAGLDPLLSPPPPHPHHLPLPLLFPIHILNPTS